MDFAYTVNIFVDESGTFTAGAARPNSWCAIAAYVSPEVDQPRLERLMERLRLEFGGGDEVKISDLPEPALLRFLEDLSQLRGLLFAVASDVSLHDLSAIEAHKAAQCAKVLEHVGKMIYEEGREGVRRLAADIEALPLQLYTQLQLQIVLLHEALKMSPLYFVQRFPETLGVFTWRVDRKDLLPTAYEATFRTVLPAVLQSLSIADPMICLEGADYRHMARFEFADGKPPSYLKEAYGIEVKSGIDVGKMIREDFEYVDSARVAGVQAADLCASALRRLLRGKIRDARSAAHLLGANMLQPERGKQALKLLSLGREAYVSPTHADLIRAMRTRNRQLLV